MDKTKATVTLKFHGSSKECHEWAERLLGQDPMGDLKRPVMVQVGNFVSLKGDVKGYVAGGTSAKSCEATITVEVFP
jgi:hypothetical protein